MSKTSIERILPTSRFFSALQQSVTLSLQYIWQHIYVTSGLKVDDITTRSANLPNHLSWNTQEKDKIATNQTLSFNLSPWGTLEVYLRSFKKILRRWCRIFCRSWRKFLARRDEWKTLDLDPTFFFIKDFNLLIIKTQETLHPNTGAIKKGSLRSELLFLLISYFQSLEIFGYLPFLCELKLSNANAFVNMGSWSYPSFCIQVVIYSVMRFCPSSWFMLFYL